MNIFLGYLLFAYVLVTFIMLIDYVRFKNDLFNFLQDLYYDLEILKIDTTDYKYKIKKLFEKQV